MCSDHDKIADIQRVARMLNSLLENLNIAEENKGKMNPTEAVRWVILTSCRGF